MSISEDSMKRRGQRLHRCSSCNKKGKAHMGERTLLLGYDLCDDRIQMAVYNRKEMEPELVGQTEENPEAIYDTVVELEGRMPIRDFMRHIKQGEKIKVDGRTSDPVNVLAYYFRKTLSETRKKWS